MGGALFKHLCDDLFRVVTLQKRSVIVPRCTLVNGVDAACQPDDKTKLPEQGDVFFLINNPAASGNNVVTCFAVDESKQEL